MRFAKRFECSGAKGKSNDSRYVALNVIEAVGFLATGWTTRMRISYETASLLRQEVVPTKAIPRKDRVDSSSTHRLLC